ncbi:MAG TPA: cytochrome o ubiquinol oxidase subunit IV [Albitalea sp.]|uniref:cytochrome o ubiquinol oxidase subunit IV n=1 Tax=Piscinibacter sp. TaxID=1903157 RepID=UPI002ED23701
MKPATFDQVPGDIPAAEESGSSGLLVYTIGLLLALALTATSFWIANTHMLWAPGTPLGLAVLAVAQMGVQLVFFLHITSGPENTNNSLALAFGVLVVTLIITGSLVIMNDLNMTPGGMRAPMEGR